MNTPQIWPLSYLLCAIGYTPIKKLQVFQNIHTILIFLIIITPFAISIYNIIPTYATSASLGFSYIFFNSILPVQYILGVRYCRKSHLHGLISTSINEGITLPNGIIMMAFIFLIVLLTSIILTILLVTTHIIPHNYDETSITIGINDSYNTNNGLLALVIITWMISSIPFSINLTLFLLVLYKHKKDLKLIHIELEQACWNMIGIDVVGSKIIRLKYIIKTSIEQIESFYTTMAILGAIAIGPIIDSHQIDPYLFYNVIVYVLCQSVFIYYMYILSNKQDDIMSIIDTPNYMFRYISKSQEFTESPGITDKEMEDGNTNKLNIHIHHKRKKRSSKIIPLIFDTQNQVWAMQKWQTIRIELKEDWFQFGLAGFKFDNKEIIQKSLTVTSGIIFISAWVLSFKWI